MRIYHNTYDEGYRHPFGAIKLGEMLALRILVDGEDVLKVNVVLEDGDGKIISQEMMHVKNYFLCGIEGLEAKVYWYHFEIICASKTIYYGASRVNHGGEGKIYEEKPVLGFQVSVYKERPLPEWYKNGIVYQIFPDRFSRSDDYLPAAKEDIMNHHLKGVKRGLIEDWYTPVDYKRGPKGHILEWEFYGGNLQGIMNKLTYLKELGISAIYLNPIFDACSNHRYDTGNYFQIAPMLGDEETFKELCEEAKKQGISIILDGVFNHTGKDSLYFNRFHNYESVGAYESKESSYYDWYTFDDSVNGYECWWGIDDLPNVNEMTPSYQDYI